jgi:hypothetical protein
VAAPAWKNQPPPEMVRRMFPGVTSWAWVSPLRLRGEHEHVPGAAYLVAVDAARTDALAQAVSAAQAADPGQVREIYAGLRMGLMRNIGRRDACRDGAPVCRDGDGRCHYCGLPAAEHEAPGDHDGPLRQETHLGWPGGAVTTATDAEAAIDAGLEAMKIHGEQLGGGEGGP